MKKHVSKAIMTIVIIFGAAYLLAAVGCAKEGANSLQPAATPPLELEQQIPSDETNLQLATCSKEEFQTLLQWSSDLDRANKSIEKLGAKANWKYDGTAILNSAAATRSCETLIQYHAIHPCEKTIKQTGQPSVRRLYTKDKLTDRCSTARTYFYDYVQNQETLIFKNADLLVDFSHFGQTRFESQSYASIGSCIVENRTDKAIDYSNVQALAVETRGFESKMMVLMTQEGLKLECYGLKFNGPFSKTELVKLMQADGTDLRLTYRLK